MAFVRTRRGKHFGGYKDAFGRERGAGGGHPCPATTGQCAGPKCKGYVAAYNEALEIEGKAAGGLILDPDKTRTTFRQFVEGVYWPNARLELSTRRSYRQRLDCYLLPVLGDLKVRQINPMVLQALITDLETGTHPACTSKSGVVKAKSAANIRSIWGTAKAVIRAAVKTGFLLTDPTQNVELPPVARKPIRILDSEAGKFQEAMSGLPLADKLFILMLAETAARFSEVRGLRPRHLDADTKRVVIREAVMTAAKDELDLWFSRPREGFERISETWYLKPYTKNGKPMDRKVRIDDDVMAALQKHIADNGLGPDDLLFTSAAGTPLLRENWARDVWNPILERAQLSHRLRPHDLRHTAASMALDGGASIVDVQHLLGHSSPRTTESIYVHPTDISVDKVAEARKKGNRLKF